MSNEQIKVKITIDLTYDSNAIKIAKEELERYKQALGEDITIEEFLDASIESMLYERFECDYECFEGETMEIDWTIEKS